MTQIGLSLCMWVPGKFTPKRASRAESSRPPGWEILPFFALTIPGALLECAAFRGRPIVGVIGSLVWAPIIWLLLVTIHREGRVRIWLSLPVVVLAYLAIGFLSAQKVQLLALPEIGGEANGTPLGRRRVHELTGRRQLEVPGNDH